MENSSLSIVSQFEWLKMDIKHSLLIAKKSYIESNIALIDRLLRAYSYKSYDEYLIGHLRSKRIFKLLTTSTHKKTKKFLVGKKFKKRKNINSRLSVLTRTQKLLHAEGELTSLFEIGPYIYPAQKLFFLNQSN